MIWEFVWRLLLGLGLFCLFIGFCLWGIVLAVEEYEGKKRK